MTMKKVVRLNQASTEDFVPVEDAADFLRLKQAVIRNYLHDGRLTTYKFHSHTLLSTDELKEYKKNQDR